MYVYHLICGITSEGFVVITRRIYVVLLIIEIEYCKTNIMYTTGADLRGFQSWKLIRFCWEFVSAEGGFV